MAAKKRRNRKPSRVASSRKSAGSHANPRRVSPTFDARGRVKIYTRKSGSETAFVYVAQSAKGIKGPTGHGKTEIEAINDLTENNDRGDVLSEALKK